MLRLLSVLAVILIAAAPAQSDVHAEPWCPGGEDSVYDYEREIGCLVDFLERSEFGQNKSDLLTIGPSLFDFRNSISSPGGRTATEVEPNRLCKNMSPGCFYRHVLEFAKLAGSRKSWGMLDRMANHLYEAQRFFSAVPDLYGPAYVRMRKEYVRFAACVAGRCPHTRFRGDIMKVFPSDEENGPAFESERKRLFENAAYHAKFFMHWAFIDYAWQFAELEYVPVDGVSLVPENAHFIVNLCELRFTIFEWTEAHLVSIRTMPIFRDCIRYFASSD